MRQLLYYAGCVLRHCWRGSICPHGISLSLLALPRPVSNGVLLGNFRPDFQLGSNSGEFVSPADFSGKTLLINFWATWCAPCREEMPMLMDLQRTV